MDKTRLKSIVTNSIPPLKATNTLEEALIIMKDFSISSVVVTNKDGFPIGIFTEHDALNIIAAKSQEKSTLKDVMSQNIFYLQDDIYVHDAYILMEEKNFRHIIVVNENSVYQGVITEGDFIRHMGFDDITNIKNIESAMSKSILTIAKSTTLTQAAALMNDNICDYAVITENDYPLGIITERDITHYYSDTKEKKDQEVIKIADNNLQTIQKTTSAQDASILMKTHGVHQLVVVDDSKNLIGLITRHDILKCFHSVYFDFLLKTLEIKSINETVLKNNTKELEDKTLFLNSVINTIPDLIWLKDINGVFLACNKIFEKLFGATEEEIIGKTDFDFVDEELATFFRNNDKKVIKANCSIENEEYLVFADGSYEGLFDTVKTPMKDSNGKVIGVLGIAHDISERKFKEEELLKLANYDTLTNLPNRSFFKAYLEKSIARAIGDKEEIALVIFDLDRFKDINDSYGHSIGDELLKEVASRVLSRLRDCDLVVRLGGDEFGVILENLHNQDDIAQITKDIITTIALPYKLSNGAEIHINSSAGIVIAPKDGKSVEELLQYSDSALYQAKNEGHGIFRYYSDEMTTQARQKIDYENRLRNALEKNEFEVYYQPQVHMQTGKIVGAEALLRWNDPKDGIISPLVFIPIAEETGLINSIGEWVLNDVCKQGKKWLDKGYRLTLAVNISAHQVRHQDIPAIVDIALKNSGFSAERLELEITESALMNREEEVVSILHALRAKGIRLAIDDFGTGYSSLSYLKRFPIDVLKIDKSFIDDIPYEKDDMAIVVAIIEMGKALGYQVLAEGTEYIEQIDFLKEKGCTMYQGYYKSKPVKALEFEKLLEEQNS